MKKKLALILASVMLMTAFTGCAKPTPAPIVEGNPANKELAVCVGPEPDTIDPALNSSVDGATLIIHGFEGLYTLDKDGVPVPGQAEKVDISEDGLTYTFTMRDNLKWSDGKELTGADFLYSWNRAIDPATASDYSYMFEAIEGYDIMPATLTAEQQATWAPKHNLNVTMPDAKTVVVKLRAVTPYFLELTAFPTFSPVRKDVVEASPDKWATDATTYIGNGPYMMTAWEHNAHMMYAKNTNYWNAEKLGPETIKFILMDEDNAILAAYKNKEILFADSMPNEEINAWKENPEFHLEGQIGTYYISFNTQKAPTNDPKVRKALALAIDREWIVKEIGKSGQIPAGAYVPKGLTDADTTKEFRDVGGDYYDPLDYAGNVEKAKALLTDAGYPDGKGLPPIEYLYNVGSGHQAIGEALQSMWTESLGIQVTLASQEWATFLQTRKTGSYYIARNGWLGDYNDPISFLDMWITGGGNNDAQWSNKEYDSLIQQIKASSDPKERMTLMHKAEDIIFSDDQFMLCPLYYYVDLYLIDTAVENFWASPLGYKYFMYATVK